MSSAALELLRRWVDRGNAHEHDLPPDRALGKVIFVEFFIDEARSLEALGLSRAEVGQA